ncbi:unnamed protein product [Nippostrongylus brasiliensis]|uniref:THO complex subunit 2 (inferred by orthology to a human protein) n=1 Tax=Nippostrongylus brasiliensis TaxID=27835 RepID=A0A0N4YYA5_NIPBR|nr:unnamed protein product [Nippostrongylus brasiliensis]
MAHVTDDVATLCVLDICQKVIALELSPEDAYSKLQDLRATTPLLSSMLLDVLVVIEGDATSGENKEKVLPNYKQAKYNLLREESEGYAKLITELMDAGSGLPPKTMMTRVLCLIGQFNLDPNRVIDICLECFECCASQKDFYIALLKEIKANKDYLCTLLGFKYTFYHAAGKETPFSLYVVTSSLIREEMIDLLKITGFVSEIISTSD